MILTEDLKTISPQQAKDKKLFGPVYHGSTSDKLEKIATQGFKVTVGHERMGDVSHGYEASDYYGGIPAPIHHLGFGVYFTTVKAIAKQFSYGNPAVGPYFLDMPRKEVINWGSPRTMMKWWLENGYDYRRTPETTFGHPETNLTAIREERMRATLNLTNTLKAKYDGVWYKGKGIRRLLDGDQVIIFDPERIYKLDKSLAQPGEIGSRVVAKVGIDPYGRGEIKVPMGMKGIITDKKRPTEFQTWAAGSEWLYTVKWDKGGIMWDVLDKWIEPYVRPSKKKLTEQHIYRRDFWKLYEELQGQNEGNDFGDLIDNGINQEYPDIADDLEQYTHHLNPKGVLNALKNVNYLAYKADIDRVLRKFYPDGKIPVRRIIGYLGRGKKKLTKRFTSVSINPNWGHDDAHVVKTVVDVKDVLAVGNTDEGELIIKSGILMEANDDFKHAQALQQTGYWGRQGAGAIILARNTGRILLPYRSRSVEQPHTWGVWGGDIDEGEEPATAVEREIDEEIGYGGTIEKLIPMYVYQDPRVGFRYSNFLAIVPKEFSPKLNWETENYRWVAFGDWPSPLHFGLKALLQNSGDDILQEIKKYSEHVPVVTQQPMDKAKYNAAIQVIRMTWADMARSGDYKNRFDYDNSFVHWMLNTEPIQNLLIKYGEQFYPNATEPNAEFQDDVEKVLEMLENRFNQRRAQKINVNDPLFLLKQAVRGRSWNGAKQALGAMSWISRRAKGGLISDDLAESIFDRLYRIALGETMYDAEKMHNAKRLSEFILTPETNTQERIFIQHYNGMKTDRFPSTVKVWRGLPSPAAQIRPGDFVTFDRGYARGYETGKYGTVVSAVLPSKDLYVVKPDSGGSEMIYWPEGHQIKKVENVPTFRQFYNQFDFP